MCTRELLKSVVFSLVLAFKCSAADSVVWKLEAFDGLYTGLIVLDASHPEFVPNGLLLGDGGGVLTARFDDGTGIPPVGGVVIGGVFVGPTPQNPAESTFGFLQGENSWKDVSILKATRSSEPFVQIFITVGRPAPSDGVESIQERYAGFIEPTSVGPDGSFSLSSTGTVTLIGRVPEPATTFAIVTLSFFIIANHRNQRRSRRQVNSERESG